ncbi:MAG: hypothetical protein M3362_21010, partial [Acidobacteriota bacterium]|nr:hypothetical protein [Acidobacteriota bacterium]
EGTDEQRAARRTNELAYRGPCLSILRQSSVLSTGQMVPCCGVIPFRPGLQMGDIRHDTFDEALARAYNDWVFKWIAFEGPVAILRQLTAETEHPLKDEDFDGICNACDLLFSSPDYMELLRKALPAKLPSLQLQEEIYSNIGLFEPPTVFGGAVAARHSRQLPVLPQ